MTTLIMPSDYGIDMLVGSSPIMGSGFLGGSPYYSDYNRCSPMWPHASPVSRLTDSVPTITAKAITSKIGFSGNSDFSNGNINSQEVSRPSWGRETSLRGSFRESNRRRKLASVEPPLQIQQQALKPCLVSRPDEPVKEPDELVSPIREKKKVSFADMTGGNLTSIKVITEQPDHPPKWSLDFLEQLTGGAKAEAIPDEWALTFSQPASDYLKWKNRLERDNIALENVVIREAESLLTGTIKVRNLAFEKNVTVRYTTTNWITYNDAKATHVPYPSSGMSYNIYDNFSFQIPLPSSCQADKIEFCLCYDTDGNHFWDNNNDKNYAVVSFKSKKSDSSKKTSDLDHVSLDTWSEFSAWQHLDSQNSPYCFIPLHNLAI